MKIAIIGTGLSSYGSIKAMIDKKIKPYVFDIGLEENKIIKKLKKQLQRQTIQSQENIFLAQIIFTNFFLKQRKA